MNSELTKKIEELCLREGFFKVGFSKYEKLKGEVSLLKEWVGEGRNADMDWISRNNEKREDVSLILKDVKSVISLAYLYDTPFLHEDSAPKISRYAWGDKDYHKVIKSKLKFICKEIKSIYTDVETKFYVDDGPLMEKAWAVKSGIGWMGKHSCIIEEEHGSFFFLSEILINKELEYSRPADNLCESCRVCIDACPTGAIYDAYKVDSNLCISYHTIENKNEIPSYIDLTGWIFGCDICQDVCPFNKRKHFTDDKSFYPMKETFGKDTKELLNINEDEFGRLFASSPVKRSKYSGFKRNLNKVLNNK